MRKTSYFASFVVVLATLLLNILATTRTDWVIYKSNKLAGIQYTNYYGLNKLCERLIIEISEGGGSWTNYTCRPFPARDTDCGENREGASPHFCEAWTSAGYASELSIGFAAIALVAILVGVSTGSRRRRIWKAVAVLVGLHAALQLASFAIITQLYHSESFPTFSQARPGAAYVYNTISWALGAFNTIAIITTGISADQGHRWAAGNRAYSRIPG